MKAADYRIPWGRPSEHLLAVRREIVGQQKHVQRVHEARSHSTIDNDRPECAQMPHLIARPKKKQVSTALGVGVVGGEHVLVLRDEHVLVLRDERVGTVSLCGKNYDTINSSTWH